MANGGLIATAGSHMVALAAQQHAVRHAHMHTHTHMQMHTHMPMPMPMPMPMHMPYTR